MRRRLLIAAVAVAALVIVTGVAGRMLSLIHI